MDRNNQKNRLKVSPLLVEWSRVGLMWFSLVYWLFSAIYLVIEPKRHFGRKRQYPNYKWYDSVLKVTPYALASYYQPIFATLIVADLLFDGVYLTGNKAWFKYGLAVWTVHHFSFCEPILTIVTSVLLTLGICVEFGSDYGYLMYLLAFLNHFEWTLSGEFCKTVGLLILGSGDLLVAWSQNHQVPYKDQLTMLSSYLYVYLNLF